MQEILIGDVEIICRLISLSASVRNILAATPGFERIPAPINDTLPRSWFCSIVNKPSSARVLSSAAWVAGTSSVGTENDISAFPWTTFWMIVSTFTFAAPTTSKISAATPGRSGMSDSVNTTSFSLWVTADTIGCSIEAPSWTQVPSSSENVERA